MMLYICAKICESISKGIQNYLKFTKGHKIRENYRWSYVTFLCPSSDDALYLYQVSRKYLKGFQSYGADAICILKFAKGHNSVKM